MTQLKAYVFREILTDYTSGIAVAVAPTVDEAKKKLVDAFNKDRAKEYINQRHRLALEQQYECAIDDPKMKQLSGKTGMEWRAEWRKGLNRLGCWYGDVEAFRNELDSVVPEIYPVDELTVYVGGGS